MKMNDFISQYMEQLKQAYDEFLAAIEFTFSELRAVSIAREEYAKEHYEPLSFEEFCEEVFVGLPEGY